MSDRPAEEQIPLLPTPTVQDGENTDGEARFRRNSLPLNAIVQVLPGDGR